MSQGYCIRCKSKKNILNAKYARTIQGSMREFGNCEQCNAKVSRFLSKHEISQLGDVQKNIL